ncbi:hypothetical protein K435DRAFT_881566 [Dendrothele bispora CBS 962.96]|uniref:Uncharacterized protein n=1 Tax=Dendrothele bispora (strain CBS 962.96) TaxID=1314807 RepID=A0A4V4HAE3_DENBC|nr:hypothetical protein K435DRAFT_881566 [Dendrothele bispora CBS 962.96]
MTWLDKLFGKGQSPGYSEDPTRSRVPLPRRAVYGVYFFREAETAEEQSDDAWGEAPSDGGGSEA